MFGEYLVTKRKKKNLIFYPWNSCKRGCPENTALAGRLRQAFVKHLKKKKILIQLILSIL